MSKLRGWQIDALIVLVLLAASSIWAARFWNTWTARGGQPVFYQSYFEPAVMMACGRGFVVSMHQPKPLEDFLSLRTDTFNCADLPAHLELDPDHVYQAAWLYLETAVGWTWKIVGISWSRMAPLFGLLFGIDIALTYAICRLAAGRLWSAVAASSLAMSSMQLLNLPHLRDYAKAPFTLALVLIVGLVVTRPVRAKTVLWLAAAYGAVLGIGYGFRTDFLADLPVLVIALFAFLDGGLLNHLTLKAAATAVLVVTFMAVSWPITSAVYTKGGCQWHVALLGLQPPFDHNLGVEPAPYDFGNLYADDYLDRVVNGYARRMHSNAQPMVFCSHDYDVQSGRYLRDIAATFPADLIVRAYGSVLQIVQLPFKYWRPPPIADWFPHLYGARVRLVQPADGWGAVVTAAAVLIAGSISIRLGLFLIFFLAYFGGYPAIQFQERHYFHLEFMGWWAIAFVANGVMVAALALRNGVPDWRPLARRAGMACAVAAGVAIVCAGALQTMRWYQSRNARQLFDAYIAAPKVTLTDADRALSGIAPLDWPQFLEVDVNAAACAPGSSVTFRYTPKPMIDDFTRTMVIPAGTDATGVTRIFLPVFEHFDGLTFSDARPGCVAGVYRFADVTRFPLLLGATLPPDWRSLPLHQRLADPKPAALLSAAPVVSLLMAPNISLEREGFSRASRNRGR